MTKDDILNKTQRGFAVFRHFMPYNWTIGKNFKNPFYDDKRASCNIYLDKKSQQYKIKDFGDSRFSGDCFSFVGIIHKLDVTNRNDFQEILKIITQELGLLMHQKPDSKQIKSLPNHHMDIIKTDFVITNHEFSENELAYWQQYGIRKETLKKYNVLAVEEFSTNNKQGNRYTVKSSETEPIFGYFNKSSIKIYRPHSELRFQFLDNQSDTYIFGLDQLPARGDILFITGGEKDVLSLAAHGFSALCFNSENAHISPEFIKKIAYRFMHIVLLYDMDKAGVEAASRHIEMLKDTPLKQLSLPLAGTKQEKDISDFFRLGHSADDLKQLFNQFLENLYTQTFAMLRSCQIDFDNPPIIPHPLVSIAGVTIGSPGNLLGITGGEGSGKSNFLGGILAGAMAQKGDKIDSLGTQVTPNTKGKAVLYFDTEQSEDQLYAKLSIALKRCDLAAPPEWFKAYCLTNLSRRERLHVILQSVDKFHHEFGGVHLVVIDGIGDLISSLNDERESINLVEELHRMAGIYRTCILCVLHLVPNGIKLRGHLGSELQRKSAGILCVEKDEKTDVSSIRALKVRSGSPLDVPFLQFAWDKEKNYHTYIGERQPESKHQRKLADLTSLAQEVFKENKIVSFTQLMKTLSEMLGVKERMARNYIQFMSEYGIIEQIAKSGNFQAGKGIF